MSDSTTTPTAAMRTRQERPGGGRGPTDRNNAAGQADTDVVLNGPLPNSDFFNKFDLNADLSPGA